MSSRDKDRVPPSASQLPMSPAQAEYLKTLSARAGVRYNPKLSSAEAVKLIEKLQQQTGYKPKVILKDEQTDG
jgi:hypothetical protein